jgi:sugar O-acyltransferase (sialic acid O-acetyltransferase NeuD family)
MKLVIFGLKDLAQLASYYFETDSKFEVCSFTVEESHMECSSKFGKPVTAFESLQDHFPPDQHMLFAPMSPTNMNEDRRRIYDLGKSKGYEFASYISTKATVFSNVQIGDNCFILENNVLQPFSSVGDNVVLWSGNHFGHHSRVDDHSFLTSHVVISGNVNIGRNCFFGVNSTVVDGISIGEYSFIGAHSLVRRDLAPESKVIPAPSKVRD